MEPEARLRSLKSTRSSIKGQMTKLHNYVVGAVDKKDIDGFQSKLARAKVLLKQFEEVENQIFDVAPDQESGIIDVSEQFYVVESRLTRFIREYNVQNPDETLNPGNNSMNATMTHPIDVRLPKINIEPFSGEYTEWQSFYDLYVKTIHENSNLSPAQKFQYLKGFLKNDAFNLLKHISITESNYFEAFRKLCARYDRKKHTIKSFIRGFMDQPAIHHANATNVRKLLDTSDEVIRGLKALGKEAESRDVWLVYILEEKLDADSRALWAQVSCEEDLPSLERFFKFLLNRSDALESLRPVITKRPSFPKVTKVHVATETKSSPKETKVQATTEANICPICKVDHPLSDCDKFKGFAVIECRQCIKSDNRCFNCLRVNHPVFRCMSRLRCQSCGKKHHTLLHQDDPKPADSAVVGNPTATVAHANTLRNCVLPTAVVMVIDENGFEHECRLLLDSGSMSTLVTEKFCNKWKIPRQYDRTVVAGISGSGTQLSKGMVTLVLRSRQYKRQQMKVEALVMAKLCSKLPAQSFNLNLSEHDIFLADPNFNVSQYVDIILGVQHVFNVMLEGRIKQRNNIIAMETIFGWVLGGQLDTAKTNTTSSNTAHIETDQVRVDEMLKLFWEIEEVPNTMRMSSEHTACEKLFVETTRRTTEGRFVVQLPWKQSTFKLGKSLNLAVSRQKSIERKFQKDAIFKQRYVQFMREYLDLGHMVPVEDTEQQDLNFLPHHGILRSSKFRVVFDASAKTSTGVSLNELLRVGPTVQPTLFAILLRFRWNKIAISADIEKMYRQILVSKEDRKLQAIVWRSSDVEPIKFFTLTTLTYGTAAAPYLATRVLNELANKHSQQLPAASAVLLKSTYVDDLMTGAATVEEAVELKANLVHLMAGAGMKLRKWISNSNEFLRTTPSEDRAELIKDFNQGDVTVKVLGLRWNPKLDMFSYHVDMAEPVFTKRKLLSESSQIFDPMGWLSPVIIKIKILFQTLWLTAMDWDDELPHEIKKKWLAIRDQLPLLEEVRIPRWLHTPGQNVELHGFCDASERAYAAVVYMRHKNSPEGYHCSLLAAKSKVAPVKKLSVARLELCAAHLLTQLVKSVAEILELKISSIICWTDSTIVLDWLFDVPIRWETFVGNRTSQILDIVKRDSWRHVPTRFNPADCASRGILPSEMLKHEIWWNSPSWLQFGSEAWPEQKGNYGTKDEERPKYCMTISAKSQHLSWSTDLSERMSSYQKVIGTVARVLRFLHNARHKSVRREGPITVVEREKAVILCCKNIQPELLQEEIVAIQQSKPVRTSLKFLNPYIDAEGLIRVKGRIQNADVAYQTKHPIILPPSKFTTLLVTDYHIRYCHAGLQLTLTMIRQRFWIIRAKQEIRNVVRRCMKCFRAKPIPLAQEMGNLPSCRVQHIRAFLKVGIDFAGPIQVFHKRGRGQRPFKSYVCLIVCTSTRAVHIELTSDLTTNSFLAALKRFVARRGLCTDIYSDCGSNFIGANKYLREVFAFLKENTNEIYNFLSRESITWHFNPPNAPHFGGLWEAAVKSMKHHLKRVIGDTILTVDELQILLAEIESILNSRPLCAIPTDGEVDVLTSGHFIVGHPLVLVPEVNVTSTKLSKLNRWEMLHHMKQHIWQRWHIEYLTTLQSRSKWTSPKPNPKVDDIVFVMDRNLPPSKWLLGRIVEVFRGNDDLVRVVSVKTQNGTIRRAVHALCKIPIESSDSTPGRMLDPNRNNLE